MKGIIKMVVRWKKTLVMEEGDEICWRRDGYKFVGTVVDHQDDDSYYVEYSLDPNTKSWTTVNQDELDIMEITKRHRPQ